MSEFGIRVGCDYTTASRLFSGDRAPSTGLLTRICDEFGLDANEALKVLMADRAHDNGSKRTPRFADWLQKQTIMPVGFPKQT